jgi:hypothetical protein
MVHFGQFNRGGQKRTTELPCGKRIIGSIREVNGRVDIHRKCCKICIDLAAEGGFCELPKFNKEAGNINGWNGVRGIQKPSKMMTTAIVNGVMSDYIVDASSVSEATTTTKVKIMARHLLEESDSDEEDEHTKLVNKIIEIEGNWNGISPLASDKYSGCELDEMPDAKLKIILNLINRQIKDVLTKVGGIEV